MQPGGGAAIEATSPDDLSWLFLERANAGNADAVSALYTADALLLDPRGRRIFGIEKIRSFYQELFVRRPRFNGSPQPAIRVGDVALTSTRFLTPFPGAEGRGALVDSATAEVAVRQPDGGWLWIIDNPNVLR